ncbi:murein hydrolase activator EnvC family protein [Enterovirga rhinocerotis]|uniref:Septal ring factor EnvC (AmiA/AmiB activator) n=1 Tax=Enterovirga rhinocerotis TaxID=1339210 RepID=A0A4R7CB88_9HYPH|nr:peptidoglycan DD-metalloendopeptidase family protein [Enterovirga rhinocerotis]TDR94017.1 septal ring factor EnvC (AmiA/AmiB activator) [Enterovirga rhinocerotis]
MATLWGQGERGRGPSLARGMLCAALAAGLGGLASVPLPVRAQDAPASAAPERPPDDAREKRRREERLRSLEQSARTSAESRQALEREIAALKADQPKLAAALVAAGQRARDAENRARATATRLDSLLSQEAAIRRSLASRRGVLAEVLGALQRLGRNPPPAMLVSPKDLMAAIRSAMLLAGLTPALREEARRLLADLQTLGRLKAAITADRMVLDAEYVALAGERDRLGMLIQARQERLAHAEADIRRERNRGERLGQEAKTLRDLLERMEAEAERARRAEEEAKAAAEAETRQVRERIAEAEKLAPARLAPRRPLAELRGNLVRPAAGEVARAFGASDGRGGAMRGAAITTMARAVVSAPADGTVVFAGPFRSYGRLLIINGGGGYYFLLAGMDAIQVEVGQFVLAGEPVAQMGEAAAPAAALGVVESDAPVLYVELRKDGSPIDPGPWWARTQSERARG